MTLIWLAVLGVAAAWLDLRTGRIPDWLTLGAVGLFVLIAAWQGHLGFALLGAVLPAGLLLLTALLAVTGIAGVGGGDVKYVAAVGAALGPLGGLLSLLLSLVIGLPAAVVQLHRGRPSYPFGPAVAFGSILSALLWPIVAPALLGR